jgi:hypothetical protein
MSYIILRGRWCNIIVLNVHAPTDDAIDDMKDSFYKELERVFHTFPKYHLINLLGDFNAKVGKEDTSKPLIWHESLREIGNDNGVRVVNFAITRNLIVRSTTLPDHIIHKFTRTSPNGKSHSQIDHISTDRGGHSCILDGPSFRAVDCNTEHYLVVANLGSD